MSQRRVPFLASAASAAPATSSAGLVSSTVVTSAPESTARPLPAVSAGLVSSTPSSTQRTSSQATKASAGSTSKSARKPPAKAAAGSSRQAPRNSAASPKSTSIVAPAPSITGSTRSQRVSVLNARAINNLELQALEASDAEVLGWSSGAANSSLALRRHPRLSWLTRRVPCGYPNSNPRWGFLQSASVEFG
ncbi:unnamed protein product [Phytophthora fragariaefolia]|uniref:Unnamed protein product n=1 Tax=Phytophthora fragariaefolia TaxID=1490495 RepID=A0A9W7D5Q2_9STRA|nr:unnamed protein product [Phytophthora fragariaefolia]